MGRTRGRDQVWWEESTWELQRLYPRGLITCLRVGMVERSDGANGLVAEWSPVLGGWLQKDEEEEVQGAVDEMGRVLFSVLEAALRREGRGGRLEHLLGKWKG